MDPAFKNPPASSSGISDLSKLSDRLASLLGRPFPLAFKSRTDGSNLRKLIAGELAKHELPTLADDGSFEIVPPKNKGIPKITLEFIDTYIVTSGTSYNLQVWNRIPDSDTLLVRYNNGDALKCDDVRFVLAKVDPVNHRITGIVIATVDYIVGRFGKFGVPTVKHQLLISKVLRAQITGSDDKTLFYQDTDTISTKTVDSFSKPQSAMTDKPVAGSIFSLDLIRKRVVKDLLGLEVPQSDTKTRGQFLERIVLNSLGYEAREEDLLYGAFPDIPNQLLEVKIQDTQTVDLGRYSPEIEEEIDESLGLSTFDVRYLIALTDPATGIIEGIILSPGERLGDVFSYVSDESYKCQRSIPMSFFESHRGKIVVNPD